MISRTAAHMAAFRALESARPRSERLFRDVYAARFLPPAQRALAAVSRAAFARRLIEAYADKRAPGARSSGVARTRLIDDWIVGECEDGAEQVVILGAGYDCRALRLPALARARVFELDRAELLARKTNRLGRPPDNLVRAPIDFITDDLGACLDRAEFDREARSVFLWEGVTNYLSEGAVSAVLHDVAAFNASLVFTYVHADAVSGRFDSPGLPGLLRELRRIGEPWTFGLKPESLGEYLAAHGLRRRADLGADEYRALYRRRSRPAGQEGYEFYRVVLAEAIHAARD